MPRTSVLAIAALVVGIPAFLITHESFLPVEHRFALEGQQDSVTVNLLSQEPLHLEFELSVQSATDTAAGVELRVNGAPIETVAPAMRYVFQRVRVVVAADAVRIGANQIEVKSYGGPETRFELRGRLHNYFGINPRFPRAFVVSDGAARRRWSQMSIATGTVRLAGFVLASLAVMIGFRQTLTRLGATASLGAMLVPFVLIWSVLAYSLATPLHIWLSLEALLVAIVVPCALVWAGLWTRRHRALVLKFAVAAMFTAIGTEILFRVYNRLNPTFIFYSDSYDRFRPRPGARHLDTRLNSRGFNDIEHPIAKPPGVRRIVAIGDSFAVGVVPYADNFLTRLEQELARGSPTDVINMGIPGADPKDYLSILVAEGLAFAPDHVLVGFFVGNDFGSPARKTYEYSYVATFVNALWQLRFLERPTDAASTDASAVYDEDRPTFAPERFLEIETERAGIFMIGDPTMAEKTSRAVGYLREMRSVAESAGAALSVAILPAEVQIDRDLQDEVIRAHQSSRDRFDFALPNRLLAAALTDAGVPFVDLLPVFEREGRSARLYKPQDTHWNIAGNRVAATALASYLR